MIESYNIANKMLFLFSHLCNSPDIESSRSKKVLILQIVQIIKTFISKKWWNNVAFILGVQYSDFL